MWLASHTSHFPHGVSDLLSTPTPPSMSFSGNDESVLPVALLIPYACNQSVNPLVSTPASIQNPVHFHCYPFWAFDHISFLSFLFWIVAVASHWAACFHSTSSMVCHLHSIPSEPVPVSQILSLLCSNPSTLTKVKVKILTVASKTLYDMIWLPLWPHVLPLSPLHTPLKPPWLLNFPNYAKHTSISGSL